MINENIHRSAYSNGEARALIAPMLGCDAEDMGDFIIIARSREGEHIGIFHTMYCSYRQHSDCRALDLIGEFIREQAALMHEYGPQHGPGES